MQLFFALTLLASATLLFLVQPMFAKMVLPRLGGTPAVWNTCMVFYQATLLGGYLYAHLSTRWLGARRQAAVHMLVLGLPWLALPIGVASFGTLPSDQNPIPWLMGCLAVSVGLPFFVVAASAPMLQTWFASTGHPAGRDPYFLYAASNLGSMLALLGYPTVVEPFLTLAGQSWIWTIGYVVLTLLTAGCAILLWRSPQTAMSPPGTAEASAESTDEQAGVAPTWGLRLRWLALSFAPSSLLLGVTTFISTDIAAVPLLWVLPLMLYLLTFVLVFSAWPSLPYRWAKAWAAGIPQGAAHSASIRQAVARLINAYGEVLNPYQFFLGLQPLLLVLFTFFYFSTASGRGWMVLLHLATFFVTAMVCHGELARSRPGTLYLTEFYLWMSVGGVLGGLFNALVAPVTFSTVIEYPLIVVFACLLRPTTASSPSSWRARRWDVAVPALLLLVMTGLGWSHPIAEQPASIGSLRSVPLDLILLGAAALVALICQKRPVRFGACLGVILLAQPLWFSGVRETTYTARSFFGVIRVQEDRQPLGTDRVNVRHTLVHGSTAHGEQRFVRTVQGEVTGQARSEPIAYFSRTGPLGQAIGQLIDPAKHKELGVIGLGAGTIAAYGQPGQTITYFEIDPIMVKVANDTRHFSYLAQSPAHIDVILGDARLKLVEQPDQRFDLLVVDAFSSDSIPLHLLTQEALALYLRKLKPEGVLLFHISNRHLELSPVLANLAADAGLVCRRCKDTKVSPSERQQGKRASEWVVMVHDLGRLGPLAQSPAWQSVAHDGRVGLWTDDFSNILVVLKWFRPH